MRSVTTLRGYNNTIYSRFKKTQCGGFQQLADRVVGSRAATQLRIILTLTTGCSRVFNANYVFIITTFITNL